MWKPQTLVETFDQEPTTILSRSIYDVALISNFVALSCVNMYSARRSFSGMERLQTPLRRTITDEILSSLAILHIHKHKDVTDIDGIITEFARVKDTHVFLRL